MKSLFLFLIVFSASDLLRTSNAIASDAEGSGDATPALVHYCSDGDTCRIRVAAGSMWINARLAGIDAPETAKRRNRKAGQPLGNDAKTFLNEKVQGKDVKVIQSDLDPFNRPVVELFVGDQNINLTMVEKGMAEYYRGKTKRIDIKKYEEAESKAKRDKVGIWAQPGYQSPSDFRKSQK